MTAVTDFICTPGYATAWSALCTLIGLVAGHWLSNHFAIGRERRKDRNAALDPIRASLHREVRSPGRGAAVSESSLDAIASLLGKRQFNRLRVAVQRYDEARQEHIVTDAAGQRSYATTDHLKAAAEAVLRGMPRR